MSYIRLDWTKRGYFFDPSPLPSLSSAWQRWGEILTACRIGDFSRTPELLDLLHPRTDDVLSRACGVLLGDAGSSAAMQKVASFVRTSFANLQPFGLDNALVITDALSTDGCLDFTEEILETFDWNLAGADSSIIALNLSRMLETRWDFVAECPRDTREFVAYRELVLDRVAELKKKYGTGNRVFMAAPADPRRTAQLLLDNLGSSDFEEAAQTLLRRRFEAATGIDCSDFFAGGLFQPLTAAVMLESFLSSSAAYEAGAKYFFGHRVP